MRRVSSFDISFSSSEYNCISKATQDFTAVGIMDKYLMIVDTTTTRPKQINKIDYTHDIKYLDLLQSPSATTGYVFGCTSSSSLHYGFFRMKVYQSSTSSSSDLELYFIYSSTEYIECSGIYAQDDNTLQIMTYQTSSSTKMYLYTITWTNPGCSSIVTSYINGIDKSYIPSRILTGPKWHFAGTNLWNFNTNFVFSGSGTIGYVYSSDQTESYISLQTYTSSTSSPTLQSSSFQSKGTSTQFEYPRVKSTSLQSSYLASYHINSGTCKIKNEYSLPSIDSFSFYLGVGGSLTLSVAPYTDLCPTSGCTYNVACTATLDPSITVTSGATSKDFTITSTSTASSLVGTYTFEFRTYLNQVMYIPCYYAYNIFTVDFKLPTIDSHSISSFIYYVNAPAVLLEEAVFTVNPSTFTDYGIQYALYDFSYNAVTTTNFPYITLKSVNTTHFVIQVYTTNNAYQGIKGFYVRATFTGGYYPQYYQDIAINFEIKICTTDTITASAISDQYYLVGAIQLDIPITAFTALYNCEPIVYSISQVSPIPITGTYTNPPIVAMDNTNLIVSSLTTDSTYADAYQIKVQGGYTILTSITASQTFKLYVIAPIQTTVIDSITYAVGDTTYNHMFDQFTQSNSTAGITFSYYLEYSDGSSVDSSIFTFDGQQLISVDTTDNTKQAIYNMRVRASFDSITLANSEVYSYFTVTILDQCYRNQITSQPISDVYYNISDPVYTKDVDDWVTTLPICDPIIYTASYLGGSLPNFIAFDSSNLVFTVHTTNKYKVGTYFIEVIGTTSIYNTSNSIPSSTVMIQVGCTARTIYPIQKGFKKYYYIGISVPITVPISNLTLTPKCNPETPVSFRTNLRGGQKLPTYIQFSTDEKKYVVGDSGDLDGKNLTVVLYATTDVGLMTSYEWYIEYVPFSFSISGSKVINIKSETLEINANEVMSFKSTGFEQYTQNGYGVINQDKLSFLKILGEEIIISPTDFNIGTYKFYLVAIDDNNQRVVQTINVIVLPIQDEFTASQKGKLTAKIKTISKNGNVTVLFSEPLKQIMAQNYTNITKTNSFSYINSNVLKLTILDVDLKPRDTLFEWNLTLIDNDKMFIDLYFDNPYEISQYGYDALSITFLVNRYFIGSESQGVLKSGSTIIKKIPRQIGKDSLSQQIYDLTEYLQSNIDKVMNGNPILSFFLSYKYLNIVKKVLVFNFVFQFLLENSLQLLIFSMVNLLSVIIIFILNMLYQPDFTDRNHIVQYFISIAIQCALIGIATINVYYSLRNRQKQSLKDKISNKIIVIFLLFKDNKYSILFNAVYLCRRLGLAIILVFFYKSQAAQLQLLYFSSALYVAYLVLVRPYESTAINAIEILNEMVVILTVYHLFIFSDAYNDYQFKYTIGWSMDIIVCFQILTNTVILTIQSLYGFYNGIKKLMQRLRLKREQRLCRLELERLKRLDFQNHEHYNSPSLTTNISKDVELNQSQSDLIQGEQSYERKEPLKLNQPLFFVNNPHFKRNLKKNDFESLMVDKADDPDRTTKGKTSFADQDWFNIIVPNAVNLKSNQFNSKEKKTFQNVLDRRFINHEIGSTVNKLSSLKNVADYSNNNQTPRSTYNQSPEHRMLEHKNLNLLQQNYFNNINQEQHNSPSRQREESKDYNEEFEDNIADETYAHNL